MDVTRIDSCRLCKSNQLVPVDSDGLCFYHQRQAVRGKTQAIVRKIGLSRTIQPATQADLDMLAFYRNRIPLMSGRCEECDARILVMNYRFAKAALAHILPKEYFLSVRTNPFNLLELGANCGCHTRWDKNWESAARMKVFPIAFERFLSFEADIDPEERKRIPECFLKLMV